MPIAEITIIPIGTADPSVSAYVADIHRMLKSRAPFIRYQLTPMSTIVEGEWESLMETIRLMHELPFERGALRVSTSIKIDDRRDKPNSMQSKLDTVHQLLQSDPS
jgi:uncharacterized protein (TIGR00106 family)